MSADRLLALGLFVGSGAALALGRYRRHWPVALLAGLAVLCGSYVTSRRTIFDEDDVLNYYELYLALGAGDWSAVASLGGGVELMLPVLLRIMHVILGAASLQTFIFWLTFVGVAAAVAMYAKLTALVRDDRDYSLGVAFAVAYVSFFTASHTSRQFFADIAMLPLLTLGLSRRGTLLVSAASILSHVTSALYLGVIWTCRTRLRLFVFVGSVAIVVVNGPRLLLWGLDVAPEAILQKLTLLTLSDIADSNISNVPDVVRLALLAAAVALGERLCPGSVPIWTQRFVYLGVAVGALLVNVPFIGGRANHLLLHVGYGFILFLSLRWSRTVARVAVVAGLAYQVHLLMTY